MRGTDEVEIRDYGQKRLFAPYRQHVEHRACNKERDRKVNDDRMLSVACEERSLHIERVRGRRKTTGS